MRNILLALFILTVFVNAKLNAQATDSLFQDVKVNENIFIRNYSSKPSIVVHKNINTGSLDTLFHGFENDTLIQFMANDTLAVIMLVGHQHCSFPILKKQNGKWKRTKAAIGLGIQDDPPGHLPPNYAFRKYSNISLVDFDKVSCLLVETRGSLPTIEKHLIVFQIDINGSGIDILSNTKME